jgi:hypothetical protein
MFITTVPPTVSKYLMYPYLDKANYSNTNILIMPESSDFYAPGLIFQKTREFYYISRCVDIGFAEELKLVSLERPVHHVRKSVVDDFGNLRLVDLAWDENQWVYPEEQTYIND